MDRIVAIGLLSLAIFVPLGGAQQLSVHWEDLTSPDFVKALAESKSTCLLPFGIVEKHGPSGPLGTDMLNGRYIADLAAKQEYTVVFPPYYFGQIAEARSQPGTLAYPAHLQMELLQATMEEMSRNGCRKIIIQNAHGGNTMLLRYFGQTQLDARHDYVVYVIFPNDAAGPVDPKSLPSGPGVDGHAGENEVANIMAHLPQDAHPERAKLQSGADQARLHLPDVVYTGIWWYARFPNHYQGDASKATAERGIASTAQSARNLANAIRAIKADNDARRLQDEFFDKADHPLQTNQEHAP